MAVTNKAFYRILVAPVNTEKSIRVGEKYNQYVFLVASDANKRSVRQAVEQIFTVPVNAVNILRKKPVISRNAKGRKHRHLGYKKAYVKVGSGNEIDFSNFNK